MDLYTVLWIFGFFYMMVIYGTLIRLNRGEKVRLILELQKPFEVMSPEKWFENQNNFVGAIIWILSPVIWPCGLILIIWIEGIINKAQQGPV